MPTLSPIDTVKEQVVTSQPLSLVSITLSTGAVLYLSTHAVTWSGNSYLPRLLSVQLGAIQGQDGGGISVASNATFKIADADAFIYTNFEQPIGFKGASLTITQIYYDVPSGLFSPDYIIKFVGSCGSPQIDDQSLTITARNYFNLAPYNLPALQIQALCPWIFPATVALQEAAANGSNQQSKECPYNPSGSTNPRGNLNSGTPFTSCAKTKSDCQARGMYNGDSMGRQTGTYGGVQFNPPTSEVSRSYETGKYQQLTNNGPEAKYGDVVPLLYGQGWAQCKVLNTWPDANYQRMEVLISYGLVGFVSMVLVNNVEIPHIFGDPIGSTPPGVTTTAQALKIGWWQFVNDGNVYSQPGSAYAGAGDPYGSLAVIYIQCVVDIAAANSVPNVQVLLQGQQVRVYSNPTTSVTEFSSNPWWIVMDLLTWSNLEYSQLDIATWITNAAYADTLIPYTNQYGASGTHSRFSFTLALNTSNTADATLRSALNGVRGFLVPNYVGGLLSPRTFQTLADQQPAPMDGSNYNMPVPSFHADGTSGDGYLAYYFTEGTIALDGTSDNTTLKIMQAQIQQAPNRLGFVFQDAENTFNQDTVQITDDEDIAISGQVVSGNIQISGPNTYDHGQRLIATKLAEGYRGNMRLALDGETIGDTRGTLTVTFQTSHRVLKLNMGDIIAVESIKYGLSLANYLAGTQAAPFFRVQKVEPTSNYERVTITATFHNDAWYLDRFGQTGAPLWTSGWRSPSLAGARPLTELGIAPIQYSSNGGSLVATLTMKVAPGVNVPNGTIQPPYIPVQSLFATTGGSIPGGKTYYVCLVAVNSSGPSAVSLLSRVYVATGTNTNTVTVPNIYWDASTTSYQVYAGTDPSTLRLQTGNYSGSGGTSAQPASITLTSALNAAGELPDNKLSFIRFKQQRVAYPGIWTGQLSSASFASGVWTLGISVGAGTPFTTNALVGRQVALLGRASATEADIYPLSLPATYPASLAITANTANTLTISGDSAGVVAFAPGDQITIRVLPTYGNDGGGNYFEDAWFVNPNSTGVTASGNPFWGEVRIVAGTGAGYTAMANWSASTTTKIYIYGAWPVALDASSILVLDEGTWDNIFDTGTIYNDGSVGVLSYNLDVSAYAGTTILVQAVSVGADGTESSSIAAPVREAFLLTTLENDTDVPPAPGFSLTTDSLGQLILSEVGFTFGATNISTISAGLLQIFARDLADLSGASTLASGISSSASSLTLTTSESYAFGSLIVIDDEILTVLGDTGTSVTVARAALGSTAASHSAAAAVYPLTQTTFTPSFPPLFFSPDDAGAQSTYEYPISIPRNIVYAAELAMINAIGQGPATQQSYTGAGGIDTGAGGNAQITLSAYGTLAIASNVMPRYQTSNPIAPTAVIALLAQGNVGSPFTININIGGTLWLTLTIAAVGSSSTPAEVQATPSQIAALTTIGAFVDVSVDIVAVGSSYPGGALTIQIFA